MMLLGWGCRKARRRILEQSDGDSSDAGGLRRHLQGCLSCRQYQEESERTRESLGLWRAPEPGPDFTARTLSALAASQGAREPAERLPTPRPDPLILPLALAAGILFLIGASVFLSERPAQRPQGRLPATAASVRPIRYAEMVASNRDARLLGLRFAARAGQTWNFR